VGHDGAEDINRSSIEQTAGIFTMGRWLLPKSRSPVRGTVTPAPLGRERQKPGEAESCLI
jgi:hypothetical protein